MAIREVEVPEELKVLLPEENKAVVVVGSKGYEVTPLTEGQLEKVSKDIAEYFSTILNMDRKCPKCNKTFRDAVTKGIDECPVDKELLVDMRKSPIDAILGGGKVPDWIEMILGIEKKLVQESMTLKQMKHFAGTFFLQNFSDEGLPKASQENFQKLLGMIGLGKAAPAEQKTEAAKQTVPTPR